ncbi:alpha-amylase A-like [Culex pipiens pallens]|uniref:alpha-amylase A-like n=1 Tax=Culex pipiens pallens TaxID=42434 RepID=UPI0019541686|nr:alpha-amylase A-like [Culex pipiens pallens]
MHRSLLLLVTIFTIKAGGQFDPHFAKKEATGIVQLFEWTHVDVEVECLAYLGPNGFGAVQVSPVNEVRIMPNRSWRERYEPISYKISGRSGDESQFRSMVSACNDGGVRVYVEVVLNNMAGGSGTVRGTAGSVAYPEMKDYPATPYSAGDFNDACTIVDPRDPHEVRNCQVDDRPDLNQGLARVRDRMVEFMNKLISVGVAGFYINSAKNMWPHDLRALYSKLENLSISAGFPKDSRPFIYQDVADFNEGGSRKTEYTYMGMVTEYRFAYDIGEVMYKRKPFHHMLFTGTRLGYLPRERSVVFVDSPILQRLPEVNETKQIVTFKHRRGYKIALVFMLAHRYGTPRIMSSFGFKTDDEGPPMDARGRIVSVDFDDAGQCTGGWICEHRWQVVKRMMKFRGAVVGQPVINWVDNGQNQVAFCRGKIGFVAFNAEISISMKANLFTCLPAGIYCDLISGEVESGECTGTSVLVDAKGRADIFISSKLEEPIIVLLVSEKII